MIELKGKYNSAIVYTNNIEQTAISQIIELCNQEFTQGSIIRIMPDTHAGAGCTIGTTMTIKDRIVPNLVGVDIGCGMHTVKLINKNIDLKKLNSIINLYIPSGFETRSDEHDYVNFINIQDLKCIDQINVERALLSLGTLGGGNHFIEANKDKEDNIYLVVHSGSRYLGKQVADYYQDLAFKELNNNSDEVKKMVDKLKSEGRQSEIESKVKELKKPKFSKQLAYLEGENHLNYIHDMKIVQKYASLNRKAIISEILNHMKIYRVADDFETIHNYIDTQNNILRKGAISAKKNERVLIPINMRDGSILAIGKGNPDWNYSAPHGAGRLMSRSKAKELIDLEEFKECMEGIYTTSVSQSTLDEAPLAYKPMEEIIENIADTVEIIDIIKPIYNFKAN